MTTYCLLHLCASEARLCYPPKGYADLVACGDVLEHLLAVLSPGAAKDIITRDRLGREHEIAPCDWSQAHQAASIVVERCRNISQVLRPAADLSGKAPSTRDWTDPVVHYIAHYVQRCCDVTPLVFTARCALCEMATAADLASAPLASASSLRQEVASDVERWPNTRPADQRLHRDAHQCPFICDGCQRHTRNPLQGAFLPEMRRHAQADREERWLCGVDATWMCIECWTSHLEARGVPTAPSDLARHLGLPIFAIKATRLPSVIPDDRLLQDGREDGEPRFFSCDHCRAVLREGSDGCGGLFLYDRSGRHRWSFDAVRPVLAISGACVGLRRPRAVEWQPPPRRPDPAAPDTLCRERAWECGAWDATWMCFDCVADQYGHRPNWLREAKFEDFIPHPDLEPVWGDAPDPPPAEGGARAGRRGRQGGRGGRGRR